MTFKPGDIVSIDGSGSYIVQDNSRNSSNYPLAVNGDSHTLDGRLTKAGDVRLALILPPSVSVYHLGKVQTLDDGTQIYHPNDGQPFQLIPTTTKALL